jgi:catechol 2,3-dioxygenase-like lactoylglutathione lyase family enzyme
MITGFDHVTIAVRDLNAAITDYQLLLGTPPSWRGAHPALGSEGALFALANAAIELVAPLPEAEESEGLRALLASQGEGLITLAFCVDDAAGFSAALRERGVRVTAPEEGEAKGSDGAIRRYRTLQLSPRAARGLSVLCVERPDLSDLRARQTPAAHAVDALDHVAIRTRDPDAGIQLYGQGLGIRLALDKVLFGTTRMLFFRVGGVTLEVVQDPNVGEHDAFYGIALRVRDLEGAHARLGAAGLVLNEIRAGHKPGTEVFSVKSGTCGVPVLILRDPSRD